jgi:hypothetical protein
MTLFVPAGYVSIERALSELCSRLDVDLPRAQGLLRQALYAKLQIKIQMQATGLLKDADGYVWAGTNADEWIAGNGKVFLTDGTTEMVADGLYIPGLPDDLNFIEQPAGEWGHFLIVEASWNDFLIGQSVSSTNNSAVPTAERKAPGRYSESDARFKFREWRKERGGDIPSEREDIAHMKQFGVGRDKVRELRKTAPKLPRGKPRRDS